MNSNLASQGRKEKTLKRYSDFHSQPLQVCKAEYFSPSSIYFLKDLPQVTITSSKM